MTTPLPYQPEEGKIAQRGSYTEKWTSTEGRTEIHYFRKQDDEYLFGYNPLIMPAEIAEEILVRYF